MKDFSYITSSHPAFIENLYQDFRKDPNSIDPEFKKFFEGFDFAIGNVNGSNGKSVTVAAPVGESIDWMTNEMEKKFTDPLSLEKKKRILEKLNQGVMFEKFLHTKYIGQKRFSLEGGESTIPALDAIINTGADFGVKEVVIGMA